MNATDQLRAEHEGILLMLRVLETISNRLASGESVDLDHIEKIVEFLKVFADRCHHGKEEDFLFPALEKAGIPRQGGPIGVMLHEHGDGRDHIASMSSSLEGLKSGDRSQASKFVNAASGYIDLLRHHIAKENNVLFVMADKNLPGVEQERLYEEFERLEAERIGAGRHEAFHRLMNELAGLYLQEG